MGDLNRYYEAVELCDHSTVLCKFKLTANLHQWSDILEMVTSDGFTIAYGCMDQYRDSMSEPIRTRQISRRQYHRRRWKYVNRRKLRARRNI